MVIKVSREFFASETNKRHALNEVEKPLCNTMTTIEYGSGELRKTMGQDNLFQRQYVLQIKF